MPIGGTAPEVSRQPNRDALLTPDSDDMTKLCRYEIRIIPL